MQRRFELKTKTIQLAVQRMEENSAIDFQGLRRRLANHNSKSCRVEASDDFIFTKTQHLLETQAFQQKRKIKNLAFFRFKQLKKSEFSFQLRFWKTFGNKCAVFIGNWSEVSICIYI